MSSQASKTFGSWGVQQILQNFLRQSTRQAYSTQQGSYVRFLSTPKSKRDQRWLENGKVWSGASANLQETVKSAKIITKISGESPFRGNMMWIAVSEVDMCLCFHQWPAAELGYWYSRTEGRVVLMFILTQSCWIIGQEQAQIQLAASGNHSCKSKSWSGGLWDEASKTKLDVKNMYHVSCSGRKKDMEWKARSETLAFFSGSQLPKKMHFRPIYNWKNFCFTIVWLQCLFSRKIILKLLREHNCSKDKCRTCLIQRAYNIYIQTPKDEVVYIPRDLMISLAIKPSSQEDLTEQFLTACGDDVAALLSKEFGHEVVYTVLRHSCF